MNTQDNILSVSSLLEEIKQNAAETIASLGRTPRMALLRCVSDPGAVYMEKQIRAACRDTGIECWFMELPSYLTEDVFVNAVHQVGQDVSVDAVAVLCPSQYDKARLGSAIGERKDIGGLSRTASSRFLPCADSAMAMILDHFQIRCEEKKILFLQYNKTEHYILRRILGIRGGDVVAREDASEEPGFSPELLIAGGSLSALPSEFLSQDLPIFSVAVGPFGEPLFPEDRDRLSQFSAPLLPVPGGLDVVIPYMYALNTAIASK